MPITEELQDEGRFSVPLLADTPNRVLDAIDVRTYAFATVVVTPQHFLPSELSDANMLAVARYSGVYLGQSDNRHTLDGAGVIWWLGQEDDNGDMYSGVDGTTANLNFADQLDARIFTSFSNGLTRGSTNALATTRTLKIVGPSTRRQWLDTICAAYHTTPFEWRANPDFTVDADTQATLYPTTSTPTVILSDEGGRERALTGLRAELDVTSIDVEDYRTDITVRWNEATPGTNNGQATNTPTSTWVDVAGGTPDLRTVLDWSPKKRFRERDRRSDRWNAAHYATWFVNAQNQANNIATTHAAQTNSYQIEARATVDEYDIWRWLQVGDTLHVWDQALDLVDTTNIQYFRGYPVYPKNLRLRAMTSPLLDGYGVYLRYWNGASFSYYDLSPYVDWEDDVTTLELGTRRRFHPQNARPHRFDRRRVRRQARRSYLLAQYLQRVS